MSKEIIKDSDLFIAEVSFPSTGLGIELGWADSFHKPIICIYSKGSQPSASLKTISRNFIEYLDKTDMIDKLDKAISAIFA